MQPASHSPLSCSPPHTAGLMQPATCSPLHAARFMQPASCSPLHTARFTQPASHSPLQTARFIQPASYSPLHTARFIQPASYSPLHIARRVTPPRRSSSPPGGGAAPADAAAASAPARAGGAEPVRPFPPLQLLPSYDAGGLHGGLYEGPSDEVRSAGGGGGGGADGGGVRAHARGVAGGVGGRHARGGAAPSARARQFRTRALPRVAPPPTLPRPLLRYLQVSYGVTASVSVGGTCRCPAGVAANVSVRAAPGVLESTRRPHIASTGHLFL
jgi:hypothetical protein